MPDPEEPEADLVAQVYDALDAGSADDALELVEAALDAEPGDPVLHFLAGLALLELDRAEEAAAALARAVELDPDDAEFRARLGEALFRGCRFADAEAEVRQALAADPRLALGHHLLGLLLERQGRPDAAEHELAEASRLDPEWYPRVVRLERAAFERHLREAIDRLPPRFRAPLDEVAVTVEPLPDEAVLRDETPPLDPEILGLFVGVPLTERSSFGPPGSLPPRILVFQRNLERFAADADDLVEQIGVTLRHELGHYLGLDEDEIERAGHG